MIQVTLADKTLVDGFDINGMILGDGVESLTLYRNLITPAAGQDGIELVNIDNSGKLILISDMLQNSDLFSAYGGGGTVMPERTRPAAEVADDVIARFGDNLRGVTLVIRLIARDRQVDLQRGELRAYWDEVFAELGVEAEWRDL